MCEHFIKLKPSVHMKAKIHVEKTMMKVGDGSTSQDKWLQAMFVQTTLTSIMETSWED